MAYGPKLDIVLAVALIVVAGLSWFRDRPQGDIRDLATLVPLAAMLAWGALSMAWSLDIERTLLKGISLAAILVGAGILIAGLKQDARNSAAAIATAISGGVTVMILLYGVELLTDGLFVSLLHDTGPHQSPMTAFNRGMVFLAALAWPAALVVVRRLPAWLAAGLIVATLGILWSMEGSSMALAFSIAIAVFFGALLLPRAMPYVVAVVAASAVMAAPVIVSTTSKVIEPRSLSRSFDNISIPHRLIVWEFTATRVAENPLLGRGLDTSRLVPGGGDTVPLGRQGLSKGQLLPSHPHNAALQWWLELGFPGAAFGAVFVVCVVLAIRRCITDPLARAAALAQFTVLFTVANLSFSIWQAWFLVGIVLTALVSRPVFVESTRAGNEPQS